jgi:hypothetical protein
MGGAYVDARRFCPRSFLPFRNGGRRRISAALRGSGSYARLKRVPGAILPACSHRLRQALHRRNREVGQGDQVRGHQAGMTLAVAKPFHLRPASTAGCKRRRILATAHLTISAIGVKFAVRAPEQRGSYALDSCRIGAPQRVDAVGQQPSLCKSAHSFRYGRALNTRHEFTG